MQRCPSGIVASILKCPSLGADGRWFDAVWSAMAWPMPPKQSDTNNAVSFIPMCSTIDYRSS